MKEISNLLGLIILTAAIGRQIAFGLDLKSSMGITLVAIAGALLAWPCRTENDPPCGGSIDNVTGGATAKKENTPCP